jgi:hypothetical protein
MAMPDQQWRIFAKNRAIVIAALERGEIDASCPPRPALTRRGGCGQPAPLCRYMLVASRRDQFGPQSISGVEILSLRDDGPGEMQQLAGGPQVLIACLYHRIVVVGLKVARYSARRERPLPMSNRRAAAPTEDTPSPGAAAGDRRSLGRSAQS